MEGGIVTDIIAPIIMAVMMVGLGMVLTPDDFKRVLIYPKATLVGLLFQMIVLPLVAFGLASVFHLTPELAVGVMLIAACPGGVASNIISHLAKANTALAVTLTLISSSFSLISIPLIVSMSLTHFMGMNSEVELSVGKAILFVFLITVPTVAAGMIIKAKAPNFAARSEKPINIFGLVFLAALVVGVSVAERNNLASMAMAAGPVTIILCISTTIVGYLGAMLFRIEAKERRAIAIGTGFQNSALALVIATSFLKNAEIAIGPAAYTVVMWSLAALVVAIINLIFKEKKN